MPRPLRPLAIAPDAALTPELAFAQVLRERRLALGLTQDDLEGDGALDRSTVSKLELGKIEVGLKGILHLARRLQMEPSELVAEVTRRLDAGNAKRKR